MPQKTFFALQKMLSAMPNCHPRCQRAGGCPIFALLVEAVCFFVLAVCGGCPIFDCKRGLYGVLAGKRDYYLFSQISSLELFASGHRVRGKELGNALRSFRRVPPPTRKKAALTLLEQAGTYEYELPAGLGKGSGCNAGGGGGKKGAGEQPPVCLVTVCTHTYAPSMEPQCLGFFHVGSSVGPEKIRSTHV